MSNAAIEAIKFAATLTMDECHEFLISWLHGEFVEIRNAWPEVPPGVFVGAEFVPEATGDTYVYNGDKTVPEGIETMDDEDAIAREYPELSNRGISVEKLRGELTREGPAKKVFELFLAMGADAEEAFVLTGFLIANGDELFLILNAPGGYEALAASRKRITNSPN